MMEIDYQDRRPSLLRRAATRVALLLAVVGSIIAFFRRNEINALCCAAVSAAEARKAIERCSAFSLPTGQVVACTGCPEVNQLSRRRDYAVTTAMVRFRGRYDYVFFKSPELTNLLASGVPWQAIYQNLSEIPRSADVFLHERVTKAGARRVVLVRCECRFIPWAGDLLFWRAHLLQATSNPSAARWIDVSDPPSNPIEGASPMLRIFAGQADATDQSHFTIRVQYGGFERIVDGWLEDSEAGPKVRLSNRQAAALPH